ncbi:MAG: hypothetical protein OXC79_09100 [Candidatus Poribacteria bacterium]|nr:hypothetical protein [Candidatus Poribacteria bacterium]
MYRRQVGFEGIGTPTYTFSTPFNPTYGTKRLRPVAVHGDTGDAASC